jgi:ABC-type multidrug transport system fused ATPase/permease subunit
MDTTMFATILYFLIGLGGRSFSNFLVYWAILVAFAILWTQQLFFFASFSNENRLQAWNSCMLLLLTLFGGFIVAPDAIPDWIGFFYWWNPLAWAFRALVLNEFFSGRYDDPEVILEQLGFINPNGQVYDERWIGLGFVYMIPYAVLCTIGAGFGLHTFQPSGIPSVPRFALDPASEELVGTLEIPFTPVDLSFENVCYDVRASTSNEQLRLLHNIGGIFRHGRLTALMGSSGAGKSTLLDVLAMRKTSGTVGGEVRLNGWLQEQSSFRRCAGYVEVSIPHEFMIAFFEMQCSPLTIIYVGHSSGSASSSLSNLISSSQNSPLERR